MAGVTTRASVQESLDRLASDGSRIFARQLRLAAPLLAEGRRIEEESYAGLYGTAGTTGAGGFGRATFGNLSLLGGIALNEDGDGRAELRDSITFAAALRYVHARGALVRPFGEIGGWTTPNAELTLSRSYANGSGTATGVGETEADISYYYVRLGAAVATGPEGELALSGEIGRSRLDLEAYAEPFSAANPFEATVAARAERMTVLRLRGQYSLALGARLDATLHAGAVWGHQVDERGRVLAAVPGFGSLDSVAGDSSWVEFGARLGYRIGGSARIEIFAAGDSGEDGVGEGIHAGVALRLGL